MLWRWFGRIAFVGLAGAMLVYAAFSLSPWPAVMLIRHTFDKDSAARNAALAPLHPAGIGEVRDLRYGPAPAMRLDVYKPAKIEPGRPLVVWIHGGAFVAGQKEDLAGYLRVLAGRGHVIAAVGYSVAPGARYPAPVKEVNAALEYLVRQAAALGIDAGSIVLVGDSAGAQIAAQLAATISDPDYARAVGIVPGIGRERLARVALFCGVYDGERIKLEGPFGGFIRTVLWSYLGTKDFAGDPRLAQFSITRHVPANFPPAFVSVGSADPLAPQTLMMEQALRARNIPVESLYFAPDHVPRLEHEYQFRLELEAARQALDRLDAFIAGH